MEISILLSTANLIWEDSSIDKGFDIFLNEEKNIPKAQNADSVSIKKLINTSIKKILNK